MTRVSRGSSADRFGILFSKTDAYVTPTGDVIARALLLRSDPHTTSFMAARTTGSAGAAERARLGFFLPDTPK